MNAYKIIETLAQYPGANTKATFERLMKTRKEFAESVVVKRTSTFVRAGIDYANLASVKAEVAVTGEPTGPLPWGTWAQFPYIITHKDTEYVRLYPPTFANLTPTVEYFVNGLPANRETVEPLCLASEFRERDEPVKCFTVKADSIISLG